MSGILGIKNRTENWKTTVHFSPLLHGRCRQFAEKLGAIQLPKSGEVNMELFWKGMRIILTAKAFQEKTFNKPQ